MAYRLGFVTMAPDGDPNVHRASIQSSMLEFSAVVVGMMNTDQAIEVCKGLVENENVHTIILCPGFSHEAVGKISEAVGNGVAVDIARGDIASSMIKRKVMAQERWFPE